MERHRLFTDDEWNEIDRVTKRWSDAGHVKDSLMASPPVDGERLQAAFTELRAAAQDYGKTVGGILDALRARAPQG
ncbi:MAG: hypothetical protein M3T56_09425 [Chloroflexota bacterium]|nr:hypothetical protein [Chloroflexota bacterium]